MYVNILSCEMRVTTNFNTDVDEVQMPYMYQQGQQL